LTFRTRSFGGGNRTRTNVLRLGLEKRYRHGSLLL
jgi:hypothetical protein